MTKGRNAFQTYMAIQIKVSLKDSYRDFHLYQSKFKLKMTPFTLAGDAEKTVLSGNKWPSDWLGRLKK